MDGVVKAQHYNSHPSGVEVKLLTNHLWFNLGNAAKYVLRRNDKGEPIKDLLKAMEYINFQQGVRTPRKHAPHSASAALSAICDAEPSYDVRVILNSLWKYQAGSGWLMDRRAQLSRAHDAIIDLLWHEYNYHYDPKATAGHRFGDIAKGLPPAGRG